MSMPFVFFIYLFSPLVSASDINWLCTEESSQRQDNSILACGIGLGKDENQARMVAFDNSKAEFKRICDSSVDCKDHEITIEPKRTSCEQGDKNFKCYRLIVYKIGESKVESVPHGSDESAKGDNLSIGSQSSPSSLDIKNNHDLFKPFVYESIKNNPKVRKGLRKSELLAAFGVPNSVTNNSFDDSLTFFYRGSMCNYEGCWVTLSNNKVQSWIDFKPIYTDELMDGHEVVVESKKIKKVGRLPTSASPGNTFVSEYNSRPDPNFSVKNESFFVQPNPDGKFLPITGNALKLVKFGQYFGCQFLFSTGKKVVKLEVTLRGPGALSRFRPKADKVSIKGNEVTVVNFVDSTKGSAGYFFTVDRGDPIGEYKMRCKIENTSGRSLSIAATE